MNEKDAFKGFDNVRHNDLTRTYVQGLARMAVALSVIVPASESRAQEQHLTIVITGPLDDIRSSLRASLITHIGHLLVTAVALVVITNLALSVFVLKPIRKLLAGMRRMESGEWTHGIPVRTSDEIGRLTRGYNALGQHLESKVQCLVRAERLASVALVAIHWNRELKKPVERIRGSADYLCRHNAFDSESAHAIGRIFDQTEIILAISEKFNRDFSKQIETEKGHDESNSGQDRNSARGGRVPRADETTVTHV